MEGIRVKVRVDPSKPMPMGAFLRLHNGLVRWIPCVPERVFRICEHCGYIGHLASDCFRSAQSVIEEATRVRDDLMHKQDVDFAYANNAPHYVCPRRRAPSFHFRKTTKVEVYFDAYGHHFVVIEKLIMQNMPNILSGELSSSAGILVHSHR